MNRETLFNKLPGRHYLRRVVHVLTPQARARLPFLIVGFFLVSVMDLVGLSLLGPFVALTSDPTYVDNIWFLSEFRSLLGLESDLHFIAVLGLIIAIVFVCKSIAAYAIQYSIVKFSKVYQTELRLRLLGAFQALPLEVFVERSAAGLLSTVTHHTAVFSRLLLIPGLKALSEILFLACLFIYLLFANPLVTLSLIILFGTLALVYDRIVRRRVRMAGEEMASAAVAVNHVIAQAVDGFKEIRVAGAEGRFYETLRYESQRHASAEISNATLSQLPRYLVESVVVAFVICLVVGGLFAYGGPNPQLFSILAVFAFAAIRSMTSVNAALTGVSQLRFSEKYLEDLYDDLTEIEAVVAGVAHVSKADDLHGKPVAPIGFTSSLVMDNVSFRYHGSNEDALSNVSLTIQKGQSIGFVGGSGSGKTTMVDILLGLLTPTSGRVLVDGIPILARGRAWMTHAAYLPQQPFLLDGTVRHNIVLAQREDDIDDVRLNQAIELAQLSKVIDGLPQKELTQIGERGVKISGGQRQRIALARAIYSNRDIIFMDEATAALDHDTENLVVEAVRRLQGSVTLVIIAHRTSTLRYCDLIVEIADGRVVRSGSYQEILGLAPA